MGLIMYYRVLYKEPYLAHHGILGQKWGDRNGPPYPLGSGDHSSLEKKSNWRRSLTKSKAYKSFSKSTNKAIRKNLHYKDTPSFKIVKKKKSKENNKELKPSNFDKKKALKVLAVVGAVAVTAAIAYGVSKHLNSGGGLLNGGNNLLNNVTASSNEEIVDRVTNGFVEHPNDLFDNNLWNNELSTPEVKSVIKYTGPAYSEINSCLRKGEYGDASNYLKSTIDNITSAIDKSELKSEVTTFRSVPFNTASSKMFAGFDLKNPESAKGLIGTTFQEDGFFSSSPKYQSQFGYGQDVKLTTICPPGTKALYVGPKSEYPHEYELLLQRSSQFEILDVIMEHGRVTEIVMKAVGVG